MEGFEVDDYNNPLAIQSETNQNPRVGVRLSLGPGFPITIRWECTDTTDNTTAGVLIDSGSHTFPSDATGKEFFFCVLEEVFLSFFCRLKPFYHYFFVGFRK